MKRRALVGLLAALTLILGPVGSAGAATQGIGLSPAIQELGLAEGQASVSFDVNLSNSASETVSLRLSTLDFGSLDESGGIAFLGRTGQETSVYGLKQWMVLEKDQLTLEPGQTQMVKVTIDNKESLSPGGHYGAVIVSAASEEQATNDNVAVLPAASTLVLLKKSGGEVQKLDLDSIKANSSWVRLPNQATVRFNGSGNTHVVPRGTVELFSPAGTLISRGIINAQSSFVLPGSFRQFQIELQQQTNPWLPGRYRIVTTWRYDGTDQVQTQIQYHWYFGKVVLLGFGTISSLIVLILYVRYRKRPPKREQ